MTGRPRRYRRTRSLDGAFVGDVELDPSGVQLVSRTLTSLRVACGQVDGVAFVEETPGGFEAETLVGASDEGGGHDPTLA